ncbi:MAG: SusC/RagA family TonB-linked outer membrane protein [Candidatus Pseudobacter hemicellulosilyticus]|uniref:SusC/RagA family TonB-linked outer membrane protein n=1 Tax=Candidatus Pseudobacter hemicellulosilyticus TaxID=3121375 RepID=A0AAJ5WP07_9BACT|nr:MAG: SusC/RagA family TonB-linked outer membrane protein [Pseudobacter sp.]
MMKRIGLLATLFFISVAVTAQTVTLNGKNISLEKAFLEIESQCGYLVVCNISLLKEAKPVTIAAQDMPLQQFLELILRNQELDYAITNKNIVISRKPAGPSRITLTPVVETSDISGLILDPEGKPIPGATVSIKGTSRAISATADGRFSLRAIAETTVVVITAVGYQPVELRVKQENIIIVSGRASWRRNTKGELVLTLVREAQSMNEVVINSGYSQTTSRRVTGSTAVIAGEDLKGKPLANIDNLLQGKVAGLNVKAVSGRPGQSASIRIRGTNTITGNAEPLWVVDGVPLQKDIPSISSSQIKAGDFNTIFTGGIAGINPNDIATVTVLKDASAAAIYGSRAAGGVIVVTTKRGEAGKMRVSYSNNTSITLKPQRDANLMNSQEKIAWEQQLWDDFSRQGYNNNSYYPVVGLVGMVRSGKGDFAGMTVEQQDAYLKEAAGTSTNWFNELFRNSISQNHYLSLSGGSNTNTYYVSMGYSTNNGLVQKTSYERYNVSAKIELKPNRNLSLGLLTDLSVQTSKSPSVTEDLFRYAYFANPYEKPYNEDGSYRADKTYYNLKEVNGGGFDIYTPPNGVNMFREINETSNIGKNFSGTLTGNMTYRITNQLKFVGLGSFSYTDNRTDNINGRYTNTAFKDRLYFDAYPSVRTYGSITQTTANISSYLLRGQFQYDKRFSGGHYVSALAGSEIRSQNGKTLFAKRYGYDELTGNAVMPVPPSNQPVDYNKILSYAAMVDQLSGQSIVEDAFASFYGAADYSYKGKYIASFTARTDGSNNFGSNQQFNPTWSAGLSWNIDQEAFMLPLSHVVNALTLRVSTGFTGNINKSVYPQLIMDYNTTFRRTDDDYYRMGYIKNAPNKNLRWERTNDLKAALDFSLFQSRISGAVELYTRTSRDLVTALRVPTTTGFSQQSFNTSEVRNRGLEFTISTVNVKTKDFRWSTSVNMAFNENRLMKFTTPSGLRNFDWGAQVGYPLGSIFSGKVIGIDPLTGIYTFQIRPDAVINSNADLRDPANYMFFRGTGQAPITGGFNTSFTYKNFSLNIGGNYALNAYILDNINPVTSYSSIQTTGTDSREPIPAPIYDLYLNHLNVSRDRLNRWKPDSHITGAYPRLIDHFAAPLFLSQTNPTSSSVTDAIMRKNVSYLRVGSMTLSYGIPENLIKSLKLESLGFSFSMTNLFTFTNYDGIDPETPGAVYPLTRSLSVGVNVGF